MQPTATTTSSQPEPTSTATTVATLLPPVLIVIMFLWFMRLLRGTVTRSTEALALCREQLALQRETVSELRAIRQAVERDGNSTSPAA